MDEHKVRITFTEPLLGTVAKNKEIYSAFIAEKAQKAVDDELETVPELEEIGTGFHMLDGKPMIYDYVIKGFFKDACSMLRRDTKSASAALKAHKKIIDGLIFISPRRIPIELHGNKMDILERPLRGQTAKGERIALARSDVAPVGSSIEITIQVLGGVTKKVLKEWLDYGKFRGMGQWRNAGYGRFDYEMSFTETDSPAKA
jgi:hypothetical protein